jgi:hypothetical protein
MSNPIIICITFLGFSPDFTSIFLGLFVNYNFDLGGKLRGVTDNKVADSNYANSISEEEETSDSDKYITKKDLVSTLKDLVYMFLPFFSKISFSTTTDSYQ